MSSQAIIVSISLGSEDIRLGKLWFHVKGHKGSASFQYDKNWLNHPERFALEPALISPKERRGSAYYQRSSIKRKTMAICRF